jgi:hypothetical protein
MEQRYYRGITRFGSAGSRSRLVIRLSARFNTVRLTREAKCRQSLKLLEARCSSSNDTQSATLPRNLQSNNGGDDRSCDEGNNDGDGNTLVGCE